MFKLTLPPFTLQLALGTYELAFAAGQREESPGDPEDSPEPIQELMPVIAETERAVFGLAGTDYGI